MGQFEQRPTNYLPLKNKMVSILVLGWILNTVLGYPNGAPRCSVSRIPITFGHFGLDDPSLGWTFDLKPAMDGSMMISIANSRSRPDFQGLLMYVSPQGNEDQHVGILTFANQTKWKYQPANLCQSNGIQEQNPGKSTITHANRDRIATMTTFVWQNPSAGSSSQFMVTAAVACQDVGETGRPRWQKIQQVFTMGSNSTSPVPTPDTNPLPTTNPGVIIPLPNSSGGGINLPPTGSNGTLATNSTSIASGQTSVSFSTGMVPLWIACILSILL